jgi:hypothetical protein
MKQHLLHSILLLTSFVEHGPDYYRAIMAVAAAGGDRQVVTEAVAIATKAEATRHVVYVYKSAEKEFRCPPCEALAADAHLFPEIEFRWRTDAPDWVEGFPTLHWNGRNGKGRQNVGYQGAAAFRKAWERSMRAPVV